MKGLKILIFLSICAICFLMSANPVNVKNGNNNRGRQNSSKSRKNSGAFDINKMTVFAFSQSLTNEEDPQVYRLDPDINIRAMQKWSIYGDEKNDYNFDQIKSYHDMGICFIGGGTASVIFEHDFTSPKIFKDMATRDADNKLVPHNEVVPGAYRGSLANPEYRKYIIDWCKIQIDAGVDGLFLDEVTGGFSGGVVKNWNGNEGFDDYCIADFNKYLMEKYPDYTARDWKNKYGMTDANIIKKGVKYDDLANNFNYRKYLQAHGWDGATAATSPLNPGNPLAKEWGNVISNRMYKADTFLGKYTELYWQEIVNELKAYAREKYKKNILVTSNGIFPFVDFNCLGMYDWNPDEKTPDGKGADYVPVVNGHLNGSKSLMPVYKMLYSRNKETAGNVPLVTFIDWPTEMMANYNKLSLAEKKDYWQIFGAETYASGLYPAFHLRDTVDSFTATAAGIMDFFRAYAKFYRDNSEFFHNNSYAGKTVNVGKTGISYNLMQNEKRLVLHLVNHNYGSGIIPQNNMNVKIDTDHAPSKVFMVSPDFSGEKGLAFNYSGGKLSITVDSIKYYDVIVID